MGGRWSKNMTNIELRMRIGDPECSKYRKYMLEAELLRRALPIGEPEPKDIEPEPIEVKYDPFTEMMAPALAQLDHAVVNSDCKAFHEIMTSHGQDVSGQLIMMLIERYQRENNRIDLSTLKQILSRNARRALSRGFQHPYSPTQATERVVVAAKLLPSLEQLG